MSMVLDPAGLGTVPASLNHKKRFPFVFLVDVSGSTGGPNPDIVHINKMLQDSLNAIKSPPPGSPLDKVKDSIDVMVMKYSDTPEIIQPWCQASDLPSFMPDLVPEGCTATGGALMAAIAAISDRQDQYAQMQCVSARTHILHFTDGAINDMEPGSPKWKEVAEKIQKLGGQNTEKVKCSLINFLSPKGDNGEKVTVNGKTWTGRDLLNELAGEAALFDLQRDGQNFDNIVKFVTTIVSVLSTRSKKTEQAIQEAKRGPNKPYSTLPAKKAVGAP